MHSIAFFEKSKAIKNKFGNFFNKGNIALPTPQPNSHMILF
jgi:hypothetical protein